MWCAETNLFHSEVDHEYLVRVDCVCVYVRLFNGRQRVKVKLRPGAHLIAPKAY